MYCYSCEVKGGCIWAGEDKQYWIHVHTLFAFIIWADIYIYTLLCVFVQTWKFRK